MILMAFYAAALVIVPTRELCLQVYETLEKLLHRFHWIVPGYVMGGEKKAKEKARLRKGVLSFFFSLFLVYFESKLLMIVFFGFLQGYLF